jgi:hypothetical protein
MGTMTIRITQIPEHISMTKDDWQQFQSMLRIMLKKVELSGALIDQVILLH